MTASEASAPLLVLWDIDGTLVRNAGVGQLAFREAFESFAGRPLRHVPAMAGRTERSILTDALRLNGLHERPEDFDRFAELEGKAYAARADDLRRHGQVLPGAVDVLGALHAHPQVISTVLTGNTRVASAVKLAAYGLIDLIDIDRGAYADDSAHRPDLVLVALERAETVPGDAVIVGDTPSDVLAATTHDVRALAVATGDFSATELTGADRIVDDLSDVDGVLSWLLNRP